VLNLFAYTGGSTRRRAMRRRVVHVDAAKSVVERARQNVAASRARGRADSMDRRGRGSSSAVGGESAAIITIAVILDPPSYGHGPKGEEWFDQTLPPAALWNCAAS